MNQSKMEPSSEQQNSKNVPILGARDNVNVEYWKTAHICNNSTLKNGCSQIIDEQTLTLSSLSSSSSKLTSQLLSINTLSKSISENAIKKTTRRKKTININYSSNNISHLYSTKQPFTINSSVIIRILFCLFTFTFIGASAVRLVALNVPEQVRLGGDAELQCLYDLGGRNASLYSLKWFWRANDTDLDEKEFYRFTPTIQPHKQFFPLDGIHVNVNKTDGGRLWLTNVDSRTSGRFKCEISVEGTFQTVAGEKRLYVLDFWDFYLTKSFSRVGPDDFDDESEMNSSIMPSQSSFTTVIVFSILAIFYTGFYRE